MEYVGKLGSLITSVHNFYNEINPATLSGAIDIVVVEHEDGEMACSPFHVRFGKLSVMMPQEKRVEIKVNDQVVPYVMKVGEAGEAFFVFETDYEVPEEFQTSPIMEAIPEKSDQEEQEDPPFLDIGESKDQKQGNNKTDSFEDDEEEKKDSRKEDKKIPPELQSPKMIIDEQMDKVVTKMDPYQKQMTDETDKDEIHSAIDTLKTTIDELSLQDKPKNDVYKMNDGSTLLERVIPEAITTTMVAKERFIVRPASGDIYSTFMDVTHTLVHKQNGALNGGGEETIMLDIAGYKTGSGGGDDENEENWDDTILTESELLDGILQSKDGDKKKEKEKLIAEQLFKYEQQQQQQQQQTAKNTTPSSSWGRGETHKDIIHADAQVKSVELQPDLTYRIEMSQCGFSAFGMDEEENARLFEENQITYDKFTHNPNILNDRRLVFRYEDRYYAASHTGPHLTSLLLFKKPLEETPVDDSDSEDEDSRESYQFGKGWIQWLSRSSVAAHNNEDAAAANHDPQETTTTTFTTTMTATSVGWSTDDHQDPFPEEEPRKIYAKTLRLTSEQLKSLGLQKGVNTISFSVTSAYQGTAICSAKIFYWDHDIQIVISDIDGTITKSDTLGHVFTMIGKDWTHTGVAKLYTDIANNGYHMLYLTSRAIGQADYTRDYLKRVEQGKYQLPDGPVIMSPDRLFTSLHREVIMRKPEVFKMACLKDIQRLFAGRDPFYAGFGNRITDARSYRSVNVPTSRLFTIDPYGDLKLELLLGFKSSYIHLNDLVDQIFPPIHRAMDEEYNDWQYWKSPLPEIDIPELDEPLEKEPTSPKPKPIKPDPSSLPDHAVIGGTNQNKGGGLLRSFTSRSSNNNTLSPNKKLTTSHSTPTLSGSESSERSVPMEPSISETTASHGIVNKVIRSFLSSESKAVKTEEDVEDLDDILDDIDMDNIPFF
ncbi:LNS2-domain-containing protein [Backusella circina FSU 941]|nr:LNS2-domain-containing protein [Backusella circina FSU 941]